VKVFLSFSGEASRNIALGLREWLPKVIQAVKPFTSEDIGKGERWSEDLAKELSETEFGIICVTKYNSCMPWINFEAGALSKAIPKAVHEPWVVPFLFETDRAELSEPLKQYQAATADKDGVFRMLVSLNNRLGPEQLTRELLEQEFEKWWTELECKLANLIVDRPPPPPLPWLYTADRLTERQKEINLMHIWVITPKLYQRSIDPKVQDIFKRNLEQGVTYTFVTVSSSETDEAERALERISYAKPDSFKVIRYSESVLRRLAVTDYIVINPNSDAAHPLHVFLELPLTSPVDYWIEVDGTAALGFVSRFRQLVEQKNS
jgi:TIR domain-containing protein